MALFESQERKREESIWLTVYYTIFSRKENKTKRNWL